MIEYLLRARDPSDAFAAAPWRSMVLPRLGDLVMLPEPDEPGDWQEMTVEEVLHYPDRIEIWLGGSDGWPPNSVSELFRSARGYLVADLVAESKRREQLAPGD